MSRSGACLLAYPILLLLPVACSQSNDQALTTEKWSQLVQGSWTLESGEEDPRWCQKVLLTEDVYVAAMRPVHPPGTHHTTLSLVADDGKTTCSGSMFGAGMIYAAGAGTGELRMPNGVAMKFPAGQALLLNLHIYNSSQAPLSGVSGIEIVRADPAEVKSEADLLISGPTNISLPPASETTITHTCRLSADQTAFTLFPHMHQLGVRIKTTVTLGGAPMVLHDGNYHFEEQYLLPVGPLAFRAGDTITTECTYRNTRAEPVTFGESSDTEMCFSIFFRYPRNKSTFCTGSDDGEADGGPSTSGGPCAALGAPGNSIGVGKHCTPAGEQCVGNQSATLCLADFSQSEFANFCTRQCSSDADCGTGAVCGTGSTRICTPAHCIRSPDGGAETGP
jgi:hypothetical protein